MHFYLILVSIFALNFKIEKRHASMEIPDNDQLSKEIEVIEKARLRMEKKMERKLISQAAKNFNKVSNALFKN